MRTWITAVMTVALVVIFGTAGFGQTILTIGTGDVTGVYYPAGGAIEKIIHMSSERTGLKVLVKATEGSVENIHGCMAGNFDFGLAQSDTHYRAYQGEGEWKDNGPQKTLRSVLSLHTEDVTLVAHAKHGIKSLADLEGKKVDIGPPGSGQEAAILILLKALGLQDKMSVLNLDLVVALDRFEKGKIDAFFYTVGHPNMEVMEATYKSEDAMIIPIEGPQVDKLLEKARFYSKSLIDLSQYPNAVNSPTGTVQTVGLKATLVTSADVPEEVVYKITKEIFTNLDVFKQIHPAFASLTPEKMLSGLSAPLHPGTIRYHQEAGLLKFVDPVLLKSSP